MAVIQNAKCASYWCAQLAHGVRREAGDPGGVLGLDLEWKPTFNAGEAPSRAAVLQLSGPRLCLIIQLQQLQHIPRSLRSLLMDTDLVKVGVSVEYDLAKLRKDFGLASTTYHDVGRVGGRIFYEHDPFRVVSVHNMAESLWGVSLPKSDSVRLSNWERRQLTSRQVEYAALDAMAGRAIYGEFYRRGLLDMGRLEAQMGQWLLSSDPEDRKRARGLAFESDRLRRLYKLSKHKRPSAAAAGEKGKQVSSPSNDGSTDNSSNSSSSNEALP